MASAHPTRRIIWAIDAFEKENPLYQNTLAALRCVSEKSQAVVEPVYVLSPSEFDLSVEFAPAWVDQYRPAAEAAIRDKVKRSGLHLVTEPHVIIQNGASKRNAVRSLSKRAQATAADQIVVSTHSREGMSRFMMGSFAETLLLHSPIPVLVVGGNPIPGSCFERIIFPTDLGDYSRSLFESAVGTAKEMGAKLTLFHAIPNPMETAMHSGMALFGGAWAPVKSYFSEEAEQRRQKVEALVDWARQQGVDVDSIVDERGGNVAASILDLSENDGYNLIVMAAQSGPFASVLIGSITRQVVRHAPCPVLVLHPPKAAEEKKKSA